MKALTTKRWPAFSFEVSWSRVLSCLFLIGGVFLRAWNYFANRSFWTDEAWVAVNILGRCEYLHDWKLRPPVFQWVERFFVETMGTSEWAFRLLPFLAGVLSLYLFYRLLLALGEPRLNPVALGLFALCEPLIYFSAELKQYSIDVFVTLVLTLSYLRLAKKGFNPSGIWLMGALGSLLIWASFPSLAVLPGIGLVLGINVLQSRPKSLVSLGGMVTLWLTSAVFLYLVVLKSALGQTFVLDIWFQSFAPPNFWSKEMLSWSARAALRLFENTGGLSWSWLAVILFIWGAVRLCQSRGKMAVVLLSPFFCAFIASVLHKYPFEGRAVLFLVPGLMLFVANGWLGILNLQVRNSRLLAAVVLVLLFFQPVITAGKNLVNGRPEENNRAALALLSQNYQDGDLLFLNHFAETPFWFYLDHFGLADKIQKEPFGTKNGQPLFGIRAERFSNELFPFPEGTRPVFLTVYYVFDSAGHFHSGQMKKRVKEFYALGKNALPQFMKGKRAWFFFSHDNPAVREEILRELDQFGNKEQAFADRGVGLYLYEF